MNAIKSVIVILGLVFSLSSFAAVNFPQCPSPSQFNFTPTMVFPDDDYGYDVVFPNITANGHGWSTGVVYLSSADEESAKKDVAAGVTFLSNVPVEQAFNDEDDNGKVLSTEYVCFYPVEVKGSKHAIAIAVTPTVFQSAFSRIASKISR